MTQSTEAITPTHQEVDVSVLLSILWRKKWLIGLVTLIFSAAAAFYALKLADTYRSEVLLAAVGSSSSMNLPGQLGGLAALAGVNLGSLNKNGDNTALALEILKSRDFIGRFVEKHQLLLPLMAAKSWDRATDSLVFDEKIYLAEQQKWVRDVSAPFKPEPSLLEAYDAFMKRFNVVHDKSAGMVRLSISYYSPYLAQQWLTLIVADLNEEMRLLELNQAQRSIDFLSKQIKETNLADVRTTLYSLIEEQTKTLMLANVREEYVFKTVDAAYAPERKAAPKRSLIVVLAALLGGLLSSTLVLFRSLSYRSSAI